MARYLLKRLGLAIITLWILSVMIFFAGQVLPGDPGRAILGPFASQSAVTALDRQHLKRASYQDDEQTLPEEVTAA